jgi:hypothetical protein
MAHTPSLLKGGYGWKKKSVSGYRKKSKRSRGGATRKKAKTTRKRGHRRIFFT